MLDAVQLRSRIASSAFTFRGYNITNLGRTPELLEHPLYGKEVEQALAENSVLASDTLQTKMDLVERVRQRRETCDLTSYAEDIVLIVTMCMVQLELLQKYFDIPFDSSRIAFGYSLGETSALAASKVFTAQDMLIPLLLMSEDSVALSQNVTMGILFSRGPELDLDLVHKTCLEIGTEGKGIISPSTYLSPNSLLLLAQNDTLEQFRTLMKERFPERVHLRANPHRWAPLHTPITWQRNIPNRTAVILQKTKGGLTKPTVPIISSVTGQKSFNETNSRHLMQQWVDHPQKLWDMVFQTLASGVEIVVHVGPDPNLVPATFKRISDNIAGQSAERTWSGFGLRAMKPIMRRPWLTRLLSQSTALLRAPYVEHIILEDWLLANAPQPGQTSLVNASGSVA
ncbi:MAG: ACP S-malonyltransferase [Planctomycetia bacterium]|nr:ACP S-malonyltransferase [Planctomycetia bacterium]